MNSSVMIEFLMNTTLLLQWRWRRRGGRVIHSLNQATGTTCILACVTCLWSIHHPQSYHNLISNKCNNSTSFLLDAESSVSLNSDSIKGHRLRALLLRAAQVAGPVLYVGERASLSQVDVDTAVRRSISRRWWFQKLCAYEMTNTTIKISQHEVLTSFLYNKWEHIWRYMYVQEVFQKQIISFWGNDTGWFGMKIDRLNSQCNCRDFERPSWYGSCMKRKERNFCDFCTYYEMQRAFSIIPSYDHSCKVYMVDRLQKCL